MEWLIPRIRPEGPRDTVGIVEIQIESCTFDNTTSTESEFYGNRYRHDVLLRKETRVAVSSITQQGLGKRLRIDSQTLQEILRIDVLAHRSSQDLVRRIL